METIEVKREKIADGFLKVDEVTYQRGDKQFKREVINRGDAVATLLFNTATQKYIFVKQFRPGSNSELMEIIAGTMDVKGESAEDCIKREIAEETGYLMTRCEQICSCYSSPGSLTEKINIFQALTDGTKVGTGGGVGDEGIEIIEIPSGELEKHLPTLMHDLKTYIALIYHFENPMTW